MPDPMPDPFDEALARFNEVNKDIFQIDIENNKHYFSDFDYFKLKNEAEARIAEHQKAFAATLSHRDVEHHEQLVHEAVELVDNSNDIMDSIEKTVESETVLDKIERGLSLAELGHAGPIIAIVTSAIRFVFMPLRCLIERRLPTRQEGLRLGLTTIILALALAALLTFSSPITAGILSITAVGVVTARYVQQSTLLQRERLTHLEVNSVSIEREIRASQEAIKRLKEERCLQKDNLKHVEKTGVASIEEALKTLEEAVAKEKKHCVFLIDKYILNGYKIHLQRRPIENRYHQLALQLHVPANILIIIGSILLLLSLTNPIGAGFGLGYLIVGVALSVSTGLFFNIGDRVGQWLHRRAFKKQLQDAAVIDTTKSTVKDESMKESPDTHMVESSDKRMARELGIKPDASHHEGAEDLLNVKEHVSSHRLFVEEGNPSEESKENLVKR